MKKISLLIAGIALGNALLAQTYTSSSDGSFTTGSNWSGGSAPSLTSQSYGSVTVQNNMSTGANYTVGSFALSVSANKTLTVNGNLNFTNSGGTIDVYGTLIVTGTFTASGNAGSFVIHPGGVVDVYGNTSINNNNVITVGTSAAAPPNADLILEGNVTFASGGAGMIVNENGRVAVYGNITNSTGGGQTLQVNSGGQMYVNGNIALTGGGDQISANNTSPQDLYVNGSTTNTGGGASTSSYIGTKSSLQSTDPSFYSWLQSLHNSPLPVTLVSFSATKADENAVQLKWSTASEINFDYFVIEKSPDGKTFTSIAQVHGHGTTNEEHAYHFVDANPFVGKNYYRLKSVDFDGYTEVFRVIALDYSGDKKILVYPNPLADQKLHIDLNFVSGGDSKISISDLNGAVKFSSVCSESTNSFGLNLDSGVYIVTIHNDSFTHSSLIVIK
jgi:hypothetical protein